MNVDFYTLDNLSELSKISNYHPNSKYLLRIAVDDIHSKCKLNTKFGMKNESIHEFFSHIDAYKPQFKGIAFHVGSNCMSSESYLEALKKTFNIINNYKDKHNFEIIDIGGGFIKDYKLLKNISLFVNNYNQKFPDIKWIAEPGRLIVNDVYDLYTKVVGKDGNRVFINNSIYGDMNNILFDHAVPKFKIIRNNKILKEENTYTINIFGSTCDSIDILYKDIKTPIIQEEDVLKFSNMGAYTISSRTNFNGVPVAKILQ